MLLDELSRAFQKHARCVLRSKRYKSQALRFYLVNGFMRVGETDSCGREQSGIPLLVFENRLS